jgi:uncharacterized protein with HEPN domain
MRNSKLYIADILLAIKKIKKYTADLTLGKLKKNDLVIDAVVRNLEIIGEAAKNISVAIVEKNKNIEWKKISGLRNILAHEYFGVDVEIVWDIIKNKLPELEKEIKSLKK